MADSQNKKKYSPIISALKDGHNVSIPAGAGVYGRADISLLSNLGRDLKVNTSALDMDECGIPNAWARPLNFEAVLYRGEAEEALRERIRGEWRGLLAMFAFKERMGFDIRCYPVNLSMPNDRFLRAMRAICPPDSHSLSPNDTKWQMAHVIVYAIGGKEYPIGITSPTTLVSTAAEYVDSMQNVPWFNGRYLEDPIICLGEDDRKAFIYWLNYVKGLVMNHNGVNEELLHYFLSELGSFIDDLGGVACIASSEEDSNKSSYVLSDKTNENFKIEGGGLYKYLTKPLAAEEADSMASDLMIVASGKSAKERLLFVDAGLAGAWNKEAKSIKLFGPFTLEGAATMLINDRDKKCGGRNLPNDMRLKTKDGIFTPRLGIVSQGGAFPGSPSIKIDSEKKDDAGNPKYMYDAITPLIPLRNDILDYISSDEIAKRIRFRIHSEGQAEVITAYFNLPLKGGDYTVYKRYSPEEIEKIPGVPVLEIWPDFVDKGEKWRPYYVLYAKGFGDKTFSVEPVTESNMKIEEFNFKDERPIRIASEGKIKKIQNNTEGCIKMTNGYPALLKVVYEGQDYGAIILKTLIRAAEEAGKKWIISIDFGTTSTKIGRKEGSTGTSYSFTSLPFSITDSGSLRSEIVPEYFLPEPETDKDSVSFTSMFLTIYHDFFNITDVKHPDPLVPLLNGHIYYETLDRFDAAAPGIKTNLKWGNDTELIKRFLAQLCLQCAAEAAKNGAHSIEWRYSFPKALPYHIKESLNAIFKVITEKITQTTGISGNGGNNIYSTTEGIAAGLYFKHHARFGHAAVCVDIGGGTSDITIWNGNELLLESSLRLAGRSLFLDILFKNVKALKKLGCSEDEVVMLVDLINNKTELEFYAQVDALIKKKTDTFIETLPTCNINKEEEVTDLCDLVAIGLAGIFYYTGLMLKFLKEDQLADGKPNTPATGITELLPNMFFGGNGARLFGWAARGAYSQQHKINDLFKSMLVQAMNFNDKSKPLNITISQNLKSEAAYGLLYFGDGKDNDPKAPEKYEDTVFAGDKFYNSKRELCLENTLMNSETLTSGTSIGCELTNLKVFAALYNKESKKLGMKPINLDKPGMLDSICSIVQGKLNEFRGNELEDVPLEPVFVICLKALLQELADQWMDKHGDVKNILL